MHMGFNRCTFEVSNLFKLILEVTASFNKLFLNVNYAHNKYMTNVFFGGVAESVAL